MAAEPKVLYEFGPFRVDPNKQVLLRGSEPIALTPKAFETLLILVRHCRELVSKNDLMKAVWPDSFVEESNLTQNIFVLRKALGDTHEERRYIVTLPGRGYRFTEQVRTITQNGDDLLLHGHSTAQLVIEQRDTVESGKVRSLPPTTSKIMLAVLPFENFTGDPEQEYLSDGLSQEVITQLGSLAPERLGVIARTSVVGYKHTSKRVDQIGRELGVQYVLEGSVRRSGDQVRVSVQLIEAANQTQVWATAYDSGLHDILIMQRHLAHEVADSIQIRLGPEERRLPLAQEMLNPDAHEAYLKARYFSDRRDFVGLEKGVEYFRKAIALGPHYAPAYAGLADLYVVLGGVGKTPQEYLSLARSTAQRAIKLDPALPKAHEVLGLIALNEYAFAEAEREYKLAVSLGPNLATAHHRYASGFLVYMGRFEEANREMQEASVLDPASRIIATDRGGILYFQRRYDEAYRELSNVIDMDPEFSEAYMFRAGVLVEQGKYEAALADCQIVFSVDRSPYRLAILGWGFGVAGETTQAQDALSKLKLLSQTTYVSAWSMALVHLGMLEKDNAISWLERACSEHCRETIGIGVAPVYDSLRDDPRFIRLLIRMGLPYPPC